MAKTRLIASSPALEKKLSSLLTKEPSLSNEPPNTKINQRNNDINILSSLKIKVFNATGSDIARFEAVALNGNYMPEDAYDRRDVLLERFDGIAIFNAKKATDNTLTWGIAQDDIPNETFGEVVIQGTTPAFFTGETGDYVVPAALGLVRSDMGPAKVIALPLGDYPGIINIGGGGGTNRLHQFQVIDISETSSDGTVTLKIRVQNGHNPSSRIAGKLNGANYDVEEITLAAGTSTLTYYVYALNERIYALNHTFQSDFFPVLLLATVTVANSKLTIVQENFADNPTVDVCDPVYGAVTLTGTVDVESYAATASYKVAAKCMLNNIELPYPATDLELTGEGRKYLLAYIDKITVENDAAPDKGFEFSSSGSPSENREWHEIMFSYKLTANSFYVYYRAPSVHLFTFTTLYLNHNEASDD